MPEQLLEVKRKSHIRRVTRKPAVGVGKREMRGASSGRTAALAMTPHVTGIAVWDVASPVEAGAQFTMKVGVKCLTGCSLAGQKVDICNGEGRRVARGTLSAHPYSDKVGLYWTELRLKAPAEKGNYLWKAVFNGTGLRVAHEPSSYAVGFAAVKPADCRITVKVVNLESGAPIRNAEVTLQPNLYQAVTDSEGVATLAVARGRYKLTVFACEKAPKGIKYDFKGNRSGRLWTTDGRENMLYLPEASRESMLHFQRTMDVRNDRTVRVGLVGVVEPLVADTM
jgi:hypothetical protein